MPGSFGCGRFGLFALPSYLLPGCAADRECLCLETGKPRGEAAETYRKRLRQARSAVLNRMQRLGVDTAERGFGPVDAFCLDPRIAGKPFGLLTIGELETLIPKLEAILRKRAPQPAQRLRSVPLLLRTDRLPS